MGTAPALVQEEGADSGHGDEDEKAVDDDRDGDASSVQQVLTDDGRGYLGQDGRVTGPVPEEGDAADSTSEYEKEKAKEVQKKDDEIAEGFPPHSYFGRFLLLGKRRS